MTDQFRDRLVGVVLLLIALAWIAASIYAIPDGYSGSSYGPRAFPVWLGVLLAILSLISIVTSLRGGQQLPAAIPSDDAEAIAEPSGKDELWAAATVFGFLLLMLGGMWLFGFLASTIILVAFFLWFVLGSRSVLLTVLLSIGLGAGIWYGMSRFLGVYLPTGLWGI
ncbi:MAG: tripartite tricarboxylate transporter TctB family protein [Devosia sp.]|jgi:hypothetical protein|nr:tripartite tricarboxylate transporter TctB family protein [Devosia sp.]